MTLECECGKTVEDMRGARGHAKFKNDERHGPAMELADDWKTLFSEVDPDEEPTAPDTTKPDEKTKPVDRTTDRETDDAGPSPDEDDEPDANPGTLRDRLTKAATDDVRHLWRDDL